ncbi:MAG: ABC transporter substrate-binding protein, partial [Anaerolineae bacterium]|nr:ABC transporter substrate-binding protein [Anaerolineae bacterium]
MFKNTKWLAVAVLVISALVLGACAPAEVEPEVVTIEVPGPGGETIIITATPAAVEPTEEPTEEPVVIDRNGAWLDTIIMVEEPNADAAVTRLEVGDIDIYAYSVSEPDVAARITGGDLNYATAYGSYNELTFNPYGPEFDDGRLNPFAVPAIREAMNWLVDRDYIAQEICGGLAVPRFVAINTASKDFGELADVIAEIAITYAYDKERAQEVISTEMEALGAELVDGIWNYNGEPVEIIALIRTEDERLDIGDYVSNQLEDIGFQVFRDYKTSAEASPCWLNTPPNEGCFHFYTGGWVSTVISRNAQYNFGDFYSPLGWPGAPLWDAYTPSDEFYAVIESLYNSDYADGAERRELMAQVLPLSMQDSVRIWLKDDIGVAPFRSDIAVSSDLSGSIYGSRIWAYTAQRVGEVGGSITIAMPSILTEPWNPIGGSNWVYDMMPIRAVGEGASVYSPYTGIVLPNLFERAELFIEEGYPVDYATTSDWLTLEFVEGGNVVPGDAWADWDAENQVFITADERFGEEVTAIRKSVVYYPADLYDTVKWHDGSPFSAGDVILYLILNFDMSKEASPYYDDATVPSFNNFMLNFKGARITSTDPLVVEWYSDSWDLEAEQQITTLWPDYAQGPGAWHNVAIGLMAEADGTAVFNEGKADVLEVDRLNYISGETVDLMAANLEIARTDGWIPFEATMSQYVDADEIALRYDNLAEFFRRRGHFWIGT